MVSHFIQAKRLTLLTEPAQVDAILSAISVLDQEALQRLGGWGPLEEISSATQFDGIEGAPSGVFITSDGQFEVSGTIYVTLQYGGSRDSTSMSDSYPALIRGKFDEHRRPTITQVEVDNTSFYE